MGPDAKKKIKGIPDIVFCLDVTGSMRECLEQLKAHLGSFIAELEKPVAVQDGVVGVVTDWRLRLLPFRDLEADPPTGDHPAIVDDFPFCETTSEFRVQLEDPRCEASGGGDEPESALDAIYRATKKSAWRPADEAHRFVILFTDATTKGTLHPSTRGVPNDVQEVVQALRIQRIKLIMFAPTASEYVALYKAFEGDAGRAQLAIDYKLKKDREEAVAFFKMEDDAAKAEFASILTSLAKTISMQSSTEL